MVQRCQIVAPRWPNNISSAADNVIFKIRAQNIECSRPVETKYCQYPPIQFLWIKIRSAWPDNGPFFCSFSKKNGPIMPLDQNPHQTVTRVLRLFNVCVRVFYASNETILLVYIPAKIKMSFIWKDDVLFAKIGIFCKSIASPLPSVVQSYTQPYSFGGSLKLIICQIRYELSATIYEISTSWK